MLRAEASDIEQKETSEKAGQAELRLERPPRNERSMNRPWRRSTYEHEPYPHLARPRKA
jgi:hypothetical protein